MKSGMQTYFFLASESKVLVLDIVKKIQDPEKIHPGSRGKNTALFRKNTV
jgi:hypothetical protein